MAKEIWCVVGAVEGVVLATSDYEEASSYCDRKFKDAECANPQGLPTTPYWVETVSATSTPLCMLFDME